MTTFLCREENRSDWFILEDDHWRRKVSLSVVGQIGPFGSKRRGGDFLQCTYAGELEFWGDPSPFSHASEGHASLGEFCSQMMHTLPVNWWQGDPGMDKSQLDWLEKNYEKLLRLYRDKWILVDGRHNVRFVADTFDAVSSKAKSLGIHAPFITRITRWE